MYFPALLALCVANQNCDVTRLFLAGCELQDKLLFVARSFAGQTLTRTVRLLKSLALFHTWPGPWPSSSVVKRDLSVAAETSPGKRPWKEGNLKTGKLL